MKEWHKKKSLVQIHDFEKGQTGIDNIFRTIHDFKSNQERHSEIEDKDFIRTGIGMVGK